MQHQLAGRDITFGGAQSGGAVRVEPVDHLQLTDGRGVVFRRRIEVQQTLLDTLQGCGASDCLGGREDGEDRVLRHCVAVQPPLSGRAGVDIAIAVRCHRDNPGHTRRTGAQSVQNGVTPDFQIVWVDVLHWFLP